MQNPGLPSIFWTTLLVAAAILTLATLIGRFWASFFPQRLKPIALFYLSPVLGLTYLVVLATLLGRILPLGNSMLVPTAVGLSLVVGLFFERQKLQALRQAVLISGFGIVCGVSILVPLAGIGGFNAHNDAFTYLAHSTWLQTHAFNDSISSSAITPLNTQILFYQTHGLRMGGSFFLAMVQALLRHATAYEVYPGVVIAAISACCLAIGFAISPVFKEIGRGSRLALLALPAFSLGGITFGANFGFLPQTIGLAFGASWIFLLGPLLHVIENKTDQLAVITQAAIPCSLLFVGLVFAYSEIAPFLLVVMLGCVLFSGWRSKAWKPLLIFSATVLIGVVAFLNFEILRAYAALRSQSGAVVGSPVDWNLLGYIAHAVGEHGGAWADYQWTSVASAGTLAADFGPLLLVVTLLALCAAGRSFWTSLINGTLLPVALLLALFSLVFLYFRYGVQSPFSRGLGQSWSQFKISEWSHPFVMTLVIFAVLQLRAQKYFNWVVVFLFMSAGIFAQQIAVSSMNPVRGYYRDVTDVNAFYNKFRASILQYCSSDSTIYLALNGEHAKFREMALLYLGDRIVASDWSDDVYFSALPEGQKVQRLVKKDCVVEAAGSNGGLVNAKRIGPIQLGKLGDETQIRTESIVGGYGKESDGANWWYWIERKITFNFQSLTPPPDVAGKTRIRFEYSTRGEQVLTLLIQKANGARETIAIQSDGVAPGVFDRTLDVNAMDLLALTIETNGKASPLSPQDARSAAWVIRNLSISPQR